jgi:hypothetical protein
MDEIPCFISKWSIIFFIVLSGVRLSPFGTAATTGLLYQPQVTYDSDCVVIGGINIGRRTEALGENFTQRHFVHHKSHMTRPGLEYEATAVGSRRPTT